MAEHPIKSRMCPALRHDLNILYSRLLLLPTHMKWRFANGIAGFIKLFALAGCLMIPLGVHAAVLYGWTIADQIVKFDTANPNNVEVVSNLSGLPPTMNVRAGGLAWDPTKPDKVYTLGHRSGFGPYWLLEIDIDTGATNPIFILQGYSMSALTYMDNENITGLVTARANSGNQDTDLYHLEYDGLMTLLLQTSFDNQTLAWDSENDVLHTVGAPASIGGTSYL